MKSGWQKLKERREKEERAKRGRQLVTQFFANKEGGGQDPPTATTTGSHFGEGEAGPSSCHVPPNTNVEVQKDRTGTSSAEEPAPTSGLDVAASSPDTSAEVQEDRTRTSGSDGASDSGIVEGTESKPHSRPYMVSLQQQEGQHQCGGALVRKDFVLTSAHCNKLGLTAVLGAHNIKKPEKSQQRIQVARYHVHPNYKVGLCDFDVMLLKLKTNSILNKYVKPIGLPKKDKRIVANTKCAVAGWGMRPPSTAASDVLRESAVKTRSVHECKNIWRDSFNISQMICTHSSGKKGGICQGDSGGPLICGRDAQGIAAYYGPDKCDDPKYPHVFMKIPSFVQWMKEVMKKRD